MNNLISIHMEYLSDSGQTITVTNNDSHNGMRAVEIAHEGEDTHTLYLNNNNEIDCLIEMLQKIKDTK